MPLDKRTDGKMTIFLESRVSDYKWKINVKEKNPISLPQAIIVLKNVRKGRKGKKGKSGGGERVRIQEKGSVGKEVNEGWDKKATKGEEIWPDTQLSKS